MVSTRTDASHPGDLPSPGNAFFSKCRERSVVSRAPVPLGPEWAKTLARLLSKGPEGNRPAPWIFGASSLGAWPSAPGTAKPPDFIGIDKDLAPDEASAGRGPGPRGIRNELAWYGDLEELQLALAEVAKPALDLILVDVLERLADPRPLLAFCRAHLLRHPGSCLVVMSTAKAAKEAGGLPAEHHFREWSVAQLGAFLGGAGFDVSEVIEPSPGSAGPAVHIATASAGQVEAFLSARNLPSTALKEVLLTSAPAADFGSTGVEAYAEEKLGLLGATFAVASPGASAPKLADAVQGRWIVPSGIGLPPLSQLPAADAAVQLVQQLLFLYPELRTVEVPDQGGLGARLLQARASGLLPDALRIEVTCHGATPYVELAQEAWKGPEEAEVAVQEHLVLQGADVVRFPSTSLQDLYQESGLEAPRARVQRYPYGGFGVEPLATSTGADTLVFFGARTRSKGFPLFVDALRQLVEGGGVPRLKRVILLGRMDGSLVKENDQLLSLRRRVEIIELCLPRQASQEVLRRYAPSAICVTPAIVASQPFAVLEAVAAGCDLVAVDTPALRELIPRSHWRDVLALGTSEDLAAALQQKLQDSADRVQRLASLREVMKLAQLQVNSEIEREHLAGPSRLPERRVTTAARGTASVIVTCFNTELRLVDDLVWSLNQQSLRPEKVVFIDDGSEPDYAAELQRHVQERAKFPFAFVRHGLNRGLPAARNTALRLVETDYVVNVDSDDVVKNDFLRLYVRRLDREPELAAVSSYCDFFDDGKNWRAADGLASDGYRPLGAGLILGQLDNCFGHANSAYRVKTLREVGGWDSTDSAMWEDWALFLELLTRGHAVTVIPHSTSGYRYRASSMVRTASRFRAQRKIARANRLLPRFESARLQGILRALQEKRHEERTDGRSPERGQLSGPPSGPSSEERLQSAMTFLGELMIQQERLARDNAHLGHALHALQREHARLRSRIGRMVIERLEYKPELYHALRESLDNVVVTVQDLRTKARALGRAPMDLMARAFSGGNGSAPGLPGLPVRRKEG